MMKYPKVQTYWKRHSESDLDRGIKRGDIMRGEPSRQEFLNIKLWRVTEKIDGTNTRIMKRGSSMLIGGRKLDITDKKFHMQKPLVNYLRNTFTVDKLQEKFGEANVTIFGEGYGSKIQKVGHNYRDDQGFILFDVVVHNIDYNWWFEREQLEDVAAFFGVEIVPIWENLATFEEIEEFVMSKPLSGVAKKDMETEGIIARTEPLMLFRNGDPIMFKLKCRDYKEVSR